MRGEPIPDPRRIGQHISRALDLLHEGGASDIRVYKTKHLSICFRLGTHEFAITAPCTPRDQDYFVVTFKQRLRRLFENALVYQLAGGA